MTTDSNSMPGGIRLGDPASWFSGGTITGGRVDLHVDAGRWIVLCFLGSLAAEPAQKVLAELLAEGGAFREDHLVFYGITRDAPPPEVQAMLAPIVGPSLNFIVDGDGSIARRYGAEAASRTIVLDPMLSAVADVRFDDPGDHTAMIRNLIRSLPPPGDSVGVALTAPVLIIPRVFEFEFCDYLVKLFDQVGGEESGFLLDQDGVTRTVVDPALKRRQDMSIVDPTLREMMRDRLYRRVVPAMARFFRFAPTRADRYLVSAYTAETGGHFFRHRDDVNAGARHRRFAMTLGLNKDYEGGGIVFPEFGPRPYYTPVGGALVFSTGMLHEVQPVTKGRRFVFVPFFYGEEDVAVRLANNAALAAGEARYEPGADLLAPPATTG
jgi:hypothetical protein